MRNKKRKHWHNQKYLYYDVRQSAWSYIPYSLRASDSLFNPFSLEFLGALEHLGPAIDVIYVGQLPPVWGICGNALSQFPKFDEFLPHFLYGKFCTEETS